jgi:hypothetical protein
MSSVISNWVWGAAGEAVAGACVGALVVSPLQIGLEVGIVSELATKVLDDASTAVGKRLKITDGKLYLIKAGTTVLTGAYVMTRIFTRANVGLGIGVALCGLYSAYKVVKILDQCYEKWGVNSYELTTSPRQQPAEIK